MTLQILLWSITRQGDEVTDNQKNNRKMFWKEYSILIIYPEKSQKSDLREPGKTIWTTASIKNFQCALNLWLQLSGPSLNVSIISRGSSVMQRWSKTLQYYMLPNTYTSQSLTYTWEACQQGYLTRKTTLELLPDALVTCKSQFARLPLQHILIHYENVLFFFGNYRFFVRQQHWHISGNTTDAILTWGMKVQSQ